MCERCSLRWAFKAIFEVFYKIEPGTNILSILYPPLFSWYSHVPEWDIRRRDCLATFVPFVFL